MLLCVSYCKECAAVVALKPVVAATTNLTTDIDLGYMLGAAMPHLLLFTGQGQGAQAGQQILLAGATQRRCR
jgi:hypothetical protein